MEVLYDSNGFPYFRGKALKGKLRQEMEAVVTAIGDEALLKKIDFLFGTPGEETEGYLKFSDGQLKKQVRAYLLEGIRCNVCTPDEIFKALTDTRIATSIDESGSSKDHSLRSFRVINKGLVYEAAVLGLQGLDQETLMLLAIGAKALKHLGASESRGKGHVATSLWIDEKEMTDEYLNEFFKRGE
jgi:CRISPR-associated protein Csx10